MEPLPGCVSPTSHLQWTLFSQGHCTRSRRMTGPHPVHRDAAPHRTQCMPAVHMLHTAYTCVQQNMPTVHHTYRSCYTRHAHATYTHHTHCTQHMHHTTHNTHCARTHNTYTTAHTHVYTDTIAHTHHTYSTHYHKQHSMNRIGEEDDVQSRKQEMRQTQDNNYKRLVVPASYQSAGGVT